MKALMEEKVLEMMQGRDYTSGWELRSDICSYFYAERAFYTNALQVEGQNAFRDYFAEAISSVLTEILRDQIGPEEDSHFFVQFLTDAFVFIEQNLACSVRCIQMFWAAALNLRFGCRPNHL